MPSDPKGKEEPKKERKGGRRSRAVRRAVRRDLSAFVCAVFTWFETAPIKWKDDWINQPVRLKQYHRPRNYIPDNHSPTRKMPLLTSTPRAKEPEWIRFSNESKLFLKRTTYPVELLAVVAWDVIKHLPIHTGRLHGNRFHSRAFRTKEKAKSSVAKLRDGNASLLNYLAQGYGYLGANDPRISVKSKSQDESKLVRTGNRNKTHAERRKSFFATARKRWPQPPRNLVDLPNHMRTYWRGHASYEEAKKTFMEALQIVQRLRRRASRAAMDDL